jgi:hypothetical protein
LEKLPESLYQEISDNGDGGAPILINLGLECHLIFVLSIHQWADVDLNNARTCAQPGTHRLLIKHCRVLGSADNGAFGAATTEKQASFQDDFLQESVDEGILLADSWELRPDY